MVKFTELVAGIAAGILALLAWFDTHSGSVVAVTTIAIVVVTAWYAWLVLRQVKEMREARELAALPVITCQVVWRSLDMSNFSFTTPAQDLQIANIGIGPALNIVCGIRIPNVAADPPLVSIADAEVGSLGAGRDVRVWLRQPTAQVLKYEPYPVQISFAYENAYRRKFSTLASFQVQYLADQRCNVWTNRQEVFSGVPSLRREQQTTGMERQQPRGRFWRRGS